MKKYAVLPVLKYIAIHTLVWIVLSLIIYWDYYFGTAPKDEGPLGHVILYYSRMIIYAAGILIYGTVRTIINKEYRFINLLYHFLAFLFVATVIHFGIILKIEGWLMNR